MSRSHKSRKRKPVRELHKAPFGYHTNSPFRRGLAHKWERRRASAEIRASLDELDDIDYDLP